MHNHILFKFSPECTFRLETVYNSLSSLLRLAVWVGQGNRRVMGEDLHA